MIALKMGSLTDFLPSALTELQGSRRTSLVGTFTLVSHPNAKGSALHLSL